MEPFEPKTELARELWDIAQAARAEREQQSREDRLSALLDRLDVFQADSGYWLAVDMLDGGREAFLVSGGFVQWWNAFTDAWNEQAGQESGAEA